MKIYAPNKEYTGETAGVAFANGVAEVEEPAQDADDQEKAAHEARIAWFEQRGFGMGSPKDADDGLRRESQNLKGSAKPMSEMTREELNELAAGKGILGAADMKNKEEVIAAIEEAGGADAED